MNITYEVNEPHLRRFAEQVGEFVQASPDSITCWDVWFLGPQGRVVFAFDDPGLVYEGSMTYLACHLAQWLRSRPTDYEIDSESVYQAIRLRILDRGALTGVVATDYRGTRPFDVETTAWVDAVRDFLERVATELGQVVPSMSRIAGLV